MKRISMSSVIPAISVLTPTIPERETMLLECRQSVIVQTLADGLRRDFEHLILIDHDRDGCAKTMNRLAAEAKGEWLLPLADDDLLLPGCLRRLLDASDGADVVYPRPLVWGEEQTQFQRDPPNIPSLALIRKNVWEKLGGYGEHLAEREDNDLWTRALQQDILMVPYESDATWVYRFHGGNKSRHNGIASAATP